MSCAQMVQASIDAFQQSGFPARYLVCMPNFFKRLIEEEQATGAVGRLAMAVGDDPCTFMGLEIVMPAVWNMVAPMVVAGSVQDTMSLFNLEGKP